MPACPALIPQNGFRCALFYFGMGDLRFFGFPFACFWGFLESLLGSGRFFRLMMAGSCPFGLGCFGWGCFGCWVGLPALPACLGWGVGCSCLGCLPALGGVLGAPAGVCGVSDAPPDWRHQGDLREGVGHERSAGGAVCEGRRACRRLQTRAPSGWANEGWREGWARRRAGSGDADLSTERLGERRRKGGLGATARRGCGVVAVSPESVRRGSDRHRPQTRAPSDQTRPTD